VLQVSLAAFVRSDDRDPVGGLGKRDLPPLDEGSGCPPSTRSRSVPGSSLGEADAIVRFVEMRTILTLGTVAAVVALGPACSNDAGSDPGRLSVAASFYPLAFAVERVADPCVEVSTLTPPGVEPHDLELTPDGVEAIATADLVIYVGGGFQPAVEDALPEAEGRVLDVLDAVETVAASPEEVEGGLSVDPHVWLDPVRFGAVVDRIAEELTEAGAPGSCDVPAATSRLSAELESLDREFRTGLASCEDDTVVVTHAAFGYLSTAYGLRQEAIAGLEPDTEPTPARMAELTELVEREGITTIFTEELVSPDVATTIASEAGVRTDVLYTIEGLTEEEASAGADYLTLMRDNLDALRAALRCA
jgi:zinc transport system substrate-binding protein